MSSSLLTIHKPALWMTCTKETISWDSTIPDEIRATILFQLYWVPSLAPTPSPSPFLAPSSSIPPPLGPGARRSIARRAPPNYPDSVVVRTFTATTTARSYDWAAVDVPQGSYYLTGTIDSGSLQALETSETFSVYNSSDVSCLAPMSIPSSSAGTSLTSTVPQSASATDSGAPGPVPTNQLPVEASGKKTNVGAIAGGVVGGVAAIIILIILAFFLRRRRHPKDSRPTPSIKSTKSGKRGAEKSGQSMGKWKGLGSVDLQDPEMASATLISRGSSHKESAASTEEAAPLPFPYTLPPIITYPTQEERKIGLTPKKPARKPVPSYLDAIPTTTPLGPTTFESSPRPAPASPNIPSPAPSSPIIDSRRSSTRPLKNTFADFPKDEEEIQAELMVSNLQRSASQGEMLQMKPVHYLIPDLPLDQQLNRRRN